MSENFLSRWSRRKLESEEEPQTPEPVPTTSPASNAPAARAEAVPPVPDLPPIESLTEASDFKLFLQPGVPESLRTAALRRLWSMDPEIRDFIGPARDYGWDWNTPGGVPGGGPAPSLGDIARAIDRIFGAPEPPVATEQSPAARTSERAPEVARTPQPPAEAAKPEPAAAAPAAPRRRHGNATPA